MKYTRPAVLAGLLTGVISAGGSIVYPASVFPTVCTSSATGGGFSQACVGGGFLPQVIGALGILLTFDSILSSVGPRKTFYGSVVVSVLIALFVVGYAWLVDVSTGILNNSFVGVVIALTVATAVLSFLAARSKSGMTEQSNPMNLPVFG